MELIVNGTIRVVIGVVEFKEDNAKGRLYSMNVTVADAFWETLEAFLHSNYLSQV